MMINKAFDQSFFYLIDEVAVNVKEMFACLDEVPARPPVRLIDLERPLDRLVSYGTAVVDDNLILAGLDAPLVPLFIKVCGRILLKLRDSHRLGLARVEVNLGKALKLLDRSVHLGGLQRADIQLRHLSTAARARVANSNRRRELAVLGRDGEIGEGKGCRYPTYTSSP
ncbi:hypothetical protein NM208_g12089 [Fusarium decemcellulare]|uniref:Uncharacterized protein n=1 Tax=Fusarium decemcellulare TaxID=57161 RepID=A0ACC1RTH7_9HYPO|nr:hypothetical protein NM208_g12089 [Fusarium decemcellulare]